MVTCVQVFFIDLSKAFDTIDHDILITKLEHYGFRGTVLKLFQSYLDSRKIQVSDGNNLSQMFEVKSGVPQGSILGPLLFIIYTNDFNFIQKFSIANVYADDTALFFKDKDINQLKCNMELELKTVTSWLTSNKLLFNASKTNFVVFQKGRNHLSIENVKIDDNHYIERVGECKYLGIIIDEKLTWNSQVDSVCKRCSSILGQLSRISFCIPLNFRKIIYESVFLSVMKYCIPIWGATSTVNIKRMDKILNRGCRGVFQIKNKFTHVSDLRYQLDWLTCENLIKFETQKLLFSLSKYDPCQMLPIPLHQSNNFNTRPKQRYIIRIFNNIGNLSFFARAIKMWNSLPTTVRELANLRAFLKQFKALLVENRI